MSEGGQDEQPKSPLIEPDSEVSSGEPLHKRLSKGLSRVSWSSSVKHHQDKRAAAKWSTQGADNPIDDEQPKKPYFGPRKAVATPAAAQSSSTGPRRDIGDGGPPKRRSAALAQGGNIFDSVSGKQEDEKISDEGLDDEYLWDQFDSVPPDEGEESSLEKCFQITTVILKIFIYFLLFAVILFGVIIVKGSVLSMTAHLRPGAVEPAKFSGWVYIILIAACTPYLVTFLQMGFKIVFGKHKWPSFRILLWTLLMEAVHSFGLALLLFRVLPKLDVVRGLLVMSAVGIVPSALNVLFGLRPLQNPCKRRGFVFVDVLAFFAQLSSVFTFIFLAYSNDGQFGTIPQSFMKAWWELPVAIFCVSVHWRGNFYNDDLRIGSIVLPMPRVKQLIYARQVKLTFMMQAVKIGLMFGFAFALLGSDLRPAREAFAAVAKLPDFNAPTRSVVSNSTIPVPAGALTPVTIPSIVSNSTIPVPAGALTPVTIPSVMPTVSSGAIGSSLPLPTQLATVPALLSLPATLSTSAANISDPVGKRFVRDVGNSSSTTLLGLSQTSAATNMDSGSIDATQLAWDVQWAPFIVLVISPLLVFYLSIVAAQLHMQLIPFSLSMTLATPVAVIIAACLSFRDDRSSTLGLFGLLPTAINGDIFILHVVLGAVWWLSQLWIARHIWTPKNLRLERVDGLFASPGYCSVLLEQCLIFNRRKDEDRWRERLKVVEAEEAGGEGVSMSSADLLKQNIVPMIYICATMWHENENEMLQMLKSVVRLDEDQATRKNAFTLLEHTNPDIVFNDPDYYMFEAHIFFDDAMELNDDDEWTVNSFARLFVHTVNRAASAVFNRPVELQPPVKIPTPYGGRLVWSLPGENKLVVHLKDKNKIRHRKRWSQIMYMYYLLGYELLGSVDVEAFNRLKKTGAAASHKKRQQHFAKSKLFDQLPEKTIIQAEHTFCLALDGDVDFRPQAVQLLVDRLKRNSKVGVVCGRIHPIGSGPMVWYQKFEYAISHWLQKAAEHVMGCVLCAPGAFSLFRGSALMDDNVMGTYHRLATEAGHYVQYDQGEDRWLSTLLLQQGYRVEYVAAADALTYAPESFNEFFNQRRRWGPSTMANTMDLLMSWRHTIKMNDNISAPYMIYQALIFFSSLLGPATIVLMIAGAFNNVFGLTLELSIFLSVAPPVFYVGVCFFTKPNTQVSVAAVMSAVYALLMTAVLVATIAQIAQTSVFSPSGLFLILLAGVFITSAIFHPQEFWCLPPGLLYYIAIPSGYLLLIIYSMANLNVVSWGTREAPQRKPKGKKGKPGVEPPGQQQQAAPQKKVSGGLLNSLIERQLDEKSLCSNIAKFFRQCCSGNTESMANALRNIDAKLTAMESGQRQLMQQQLLLHRQEELLQMQQNDPELYRQVVRSELVPGGGDQRQASLEDDDADSDIYQTLDRNDLINPAWIEEECLKHSQVNFLAREEIDFWNKFIEKYLKPIDHNKEHEKKVAADLKTLRNNVCFAFFMINAIWIALIFVIQLKADQLKPLFISYTTAQGLQQNLQIEPVGLIFLSVFAVTLVLQYLAMLWHRWSTLRHIMATTRISLPPAAESQCCRDSCVSSRFSDATSGEKDEKEILREAQQVVRKIQRGAFDDDECEDDEDEEKAPYRHDNGYPTKPVEEPPSITLVSDGVPSSAGNRSTVRLHGRSTKRRLSLRKRFEKQLQKVQVELAAARTEGMSDVDRSSVPSHDRIVAKQSWSNAARASVKGAVGGGSNHLSVQLQRLSSMKPKRRRGAGGNDSVEKMTFQNGAAEDAV